MGPHTTFATQGAKKLSPEYLAYMASDEWRDLRTESLKINGRRCAGCMASDAIHQHHLFYPRDIRSTALRHVLPLCEECHVATHDQHLFHPTVFDEEQCAAKRRETIVYLQGRRQRAAKLALTRAKHRDRQVRRNNAATVKRMASWQPWYPKVKKSHIFMSHAEYLTRMPAPG
jgi:hypothetical protein